MMMQSLKDQVSCCKTHKIEDIILENTSSHNLDITPKVRSIQQNSITRLIMKSRTTFIAFYSQSRLKNLFSRKKYILQDELLTYL